MREHASDASPEDSGGSTIMNKSSAGVGEESFPKELGEFDFVPEEGPSDIDAFAPNNCYSLSCIDG
jgi:hypothetical protein